MTDTLDTETVLQEARELLRFYQGRTPSKPYTCSVLVDCIAEIERLRAASEWRDISTAPKDGTIVDLWSGVRLPDCRWESSSYAYDIPWGWGNSSRGRILNATHWMPLPAPPQRNEVTK